MSWLVCHLLPEAKKIIMISERYSRHLILKGFGKEAQQKLLDASVLVIGAGGLGCSFLPYLTAAGIGKIGIVDFDTVSESNLQRQVLYDTAMVGKPKVVMAKQRLKALNPEIEIVAYQAALTPKLAVELFPEYDLIIDGTDNFSTRYMVNDACMLFDKPLIYGAIFRFEGQVGVFNYTDSKGNQGPTYRCLYPTPPEPGSVPDCSEAGVLGVLPGFIGIIQANEAIKVLTGIGAPLSGRIQMINLLTMQTQEVNIARQDFPQNAPKDIASFLNFDYDFSCKNSEEETMSPEEFSQLNDDDFQLLDVREPFEQPKLNQGEHCIPLSQLLIQAEILNKDKPIIVFCKSGIRSTKAVRQLKKIRIQSVD
jgi:sulfur-carrier protein adenylyltransferase/sulfurtransferase